MLVFYDPPCVGSDSESALSDSESALSESCGLKPVTAPVGAGFGLDLYQTMLIVGRDCRPVVGLRVEKVRMEVPIESAFDFGFNSLVPPGTYGTIEEFSSMEGEEEICTVRWDNGELQVCSCGPDALGDLAVVESKVFDTDLRHDEAHLNVPNSSLEQNHQNFIAVPAYKATIGLRIYQGQRVDYVVPGGPAHLSNMFDR